MPINRVQFQPGLSMFEFMQRDATQAQCEAAVAAARWPDGFVCPRCQGRVAWSFRRGAQAYRECVGCGYQCSLLAGTLFQSSKLPLTVWFMVMQLLSQAKNNVAALELIYPRYVRRWIAHNGMHAFHACVELLRHPELTGMAVFISGGRRRTTTRQSSLSTLFKRGTFSNSKGS